MSIKASESYRFEQEVFFDGYLFGTSSASYPFGGEVQIIRGSDGYYWTGTTYQLAEIWLSTIVDASGLFHYYDWVVPATAADGDTYLLRMRVTNDKDTEIVGNMQVRPSSTGGGSTVSVVFDGSAFATGFPHTVRIT